MKRQPSAWKKILAMQLTSDWSPKYKELTQLNIKKKKKNKKLGSRPKQTFLQRRHTDGQRMYAQMLNISNYHKNAKQQQQQQT